jgi:signal peptidase I
VNRAIAAAPLISRFLLGLLGLLVVYVTMSLALVAVAPAVGLGWTSVVITSGSMSPLISAGDIVLASPHDGQGLGPGTVVIFTDPARPGLLTHRIESINPDGSYVTSGDANRQPDSTPLEPEQVVGVGRLLVPLVGLPLVWYWAGAWGNLALWAAGTILALWLTRYVVLEKYDRQAQPEESGHPENVAPSDEPTPEHRAKPVPIAPKPAPDFGVDDTPIEGSGGEGPTTRDVVLAFSEPDSVPTSETTVSRPSDGPGRVSAREVAAEVETKRAASSFSPVVDEPHPLPGLQLTDAASISTSWAETSRMTTFEAEDVNANRLLGVRQALGRRHDTEIPLEALVVMAVIPAWRTFPEFNATLDSDELIAHGASDVGIAVDTPDGLLVAVIRDAAAMGVMDLASEVLRLGEDAKVRSPSPGKLTGQIFTVADAGTVNDSHSISIISPGTIGILSVGRIQQKSITIDGELVVEPMMPLSLSYDHQAINEGLARRFMVHVAENLKEPALFLAS